MTTNRYVIVYEDGHAENVNEGWTYHDILDNISSNMIHSAYYYKNYPDILIKNRKIIIASGLNNIAYRYGKFKTDTLEKANKTISDMFPESE